jgi:predicted MFS family arabinose efflux permease
MLLVSGMFAMFFFLTQFFQGVLGYSPIKAGLAFLPVTLVMFGAVRLVPRVAERVGGFRLLVAGVLVAMIGMAWLSRLTADSAYFPGIGIPMVLLGVGIGTALTPLTSAGISGVAPADAGAASGLVNVAQQLGSSLGLGILVTVFASMSHVAMHERAASTLARGIGASLTGSAIFLALALTVVILAMRPSSATRPAVTGAPADGGQAPHSRGILGSRRTVRVAPVVAPDFVESYAGAEDARRCS